MNDNHKLRFRPLVGGIAIRNVTFAEKGTLGLIVTADGTDRWILSCYHVLCRNGGTMPAGVLEDIVQPSLTGADAVVARIGDQRANQLLDCAAAKILDTVPALGRVHGIGRIKPPTLPKGGMRVIKAGAETGVTEGVIRMAPSGDDLLVEPVVPGQVLCGPGDSGSVWIDADTMSPVAVTCELRQPGGRAFAKNLISVLQALGDMQVVIS